MKNIFAGGKKALWGKESWGLVKIKKDWKITSVIFSIAYESIFPEPKRENGSDVLNDDNQKATKNI